MRMTSSNVEKGNQPKWYLSEIDSFVKKDYFKGEAISEVIVSEFLEACMEVDFVRYRLYDSLDTCISNSFLSNNTYSFITFEYMVSELGVDFEKWRTKIFKNLSAHERYLEIEKAYLSYGFSKDSIQYYFSRMITLDTLVLNVDRHLNNFGILRTDRVHLFPPLFDQGLSLGTHLEVPNIRKCIGDSEKVKPFSTGIKKNQSVVPPYKFNFNPDIFLAIHDKRIPRNSVQMSVFLHRLKRFFPKEIEYLASKL